MYRKIFFILTVVSLLASPKGLYAQTSSDWYMSGANPGRTSWLNDNPSSMGMSPIWQRPIEAFIPQNTQIIAVNDRLYVSTASGLLVFDANNGDLIWQFNTQMPLGNSPTVFNGYVYVAGYDKKVYVLPVANSGSVNTPVYTYDLANAGYDTNPLVVSRSGETWIYLGDRDGVMHAFTFNESSRAGTPRWTFQAGKSGIHFSAAYNSDRVYFASNDNYAYALNAASGQQVWKSEKLPGFGFFSWWPVIHTQSNSVIFARANIYRGERPGSPGAVDLNITGGDGDYEDIFGTPQGRTIGPIVGTDNGKSLIDLTLIRNYHAQKPWRRTLLFLNLATGTETQFPSGSGLYAPFTYMHSSSGNRQPPVVMSDGLIYLNNLYNDDGDPKSRVMGWDFSNPGRARLMAIQSATAEPEALSGVGNYVLRNLCCDRIGSYESLNGGEGSYWRYNLRTQLGEYDPMWVIAPGAISGHTGWYQGNRDFYPTTLVTDDGKTLEVNTVNGYYHNHGDQNALVYHKGKVFTHRHNTIIAYGSGTNRGRLQLVTKPANASTQAKTFGTTLLTQKLESAVQSMVSTGYFRPAYTTAKVGNYNDLDNYFQNPGDTIFALSLAYPYLSTGLKTQVKTYLAEVYTRYFGSSVYTNTGWANLSAREGQPLPPDVNTSSGPSNSPSRPDNAYYLYLYAKNVEGVDRNAIYQKAKSVVPSNPNTSTFSDNPYTHNQYLAGYIGLVNFAQMLGVSDPNAQTTLTSLKNLRVSLFDKDSPWMTTTTYIFAKKSIDTARNFMYMNPDLGAWYRSALLSEVNAAMDEYTYVMPYWFVSHFNSYGGEGVFQNLYVPESLYKTKGWIQNASREELTKYLDSSAFEKADLNYIEALAIALSAPSGGGGTETPTPTPIPLPGDANGDGRVDGVDYVIWLSHFNQSTQNGFRDGDFNGSGLVDGADYVIWVTNYSN